MVYFFNAFLFQYHKYVGIHKKYEVDWLLDGSGVDYYSLAPQSPPSHQTMVPTPYQPVPSAHKHAASLGFSFYCKLIAHLHCKEEEAGWESLLLHVSGWMAPLPVSFGASMPLFSPCQDNQWEGRPPVSLTAVFSPCHDNQWEGQPLPATMAAVGLYSPCEEYTMPSACLWMPLARLLASSPGFGGVTKPTTKAATTDLPMPARPDANKDISFRLQQLSSATSSPSNPLYITMWGGISALADCRVRTSTWEAWHAYQLGWPFPSSSPQGVSLDTFVHALQLW
jgi:hypothetical protein